MFKGKVIYLDGNTRSIEKDSVGEITKWVEQRLEWNRDIKELIISSIKT